MKKNTHRHSTFYSTLCLFFVLIFLVSSLPLSNAVASTPQNGIDVVILLDTSSSMRKNDEKGYRIDAAQMFISMCDMGSRIAVIPFNQRIVDGYTSPKFTTLDSEATRIKLINDLNIFHNSAGQNTEIGIPLSLAVKMLSESTSGNRPMILIFSDGQTKFDERQEKDLSFWNPSTERFELKSFDSKNKYSEQISSSLCNFSAQAAEHFNIPIYSIVFYEGDLNERNPKSGFDFLQRLSNTTNAQCIPINAKNAHILPQVFGEMLADQIGSSLMITFEPKPVKGEENTYEILIPILNDSVLEANIYIPLRNTKGTKIIDENQIWLYNPNNTDYTAGNGNQVLRFDSGDHPTLTYPKKFVLFKLCKAQKGEWKLRFKVKEGFDVENIAFSMLYNYNISIVNSIGTTPANLQTGDADVPLTFSKKDKLILRSTFFDNETGAPADDSALYNIVGDGTDWKTIKARYEWRDESGETVLFTGELKPVQNSYYETSIDLSTVMLDAQGSQLRSGKYTLKVFVEGAGLQREISQKIVLTNNPIIFAGNEDDGVIWDIVVHDPDNPETAEPTVHSLCLSDFFTDRDNDLLTYNLTLDGAESDIILDVTQPQMKDDGKIYIEGTTKKTPNGSHLRSGIQNYVITVSDADSSITVPLSVRILDMSQNLSARYTPNIVADGIDDQGTAKKNDRVTFKLNLIDGETGEADREGNIRFYSAELQMVDASNTSVELHSGKFVPGQDGNNFLTYSFDTPNNGQEYKVNFSLFFNGEQLSSAPESITFKVPNNAPQPVLTALDNYPATLGHQPKGFPPVLEHVITDEELSFNLKDLFIENDNEKLVYSDPVFICENPDADADDYIWFERDEEDNIILHVKGKQKVTMKITATDGDNKEAVFTRDYNIVDLSERWTVYWITAIVVLIILSVLIRAMYIASLPAYNGNVIIEILEGSAIGVTTTCSLPSGKYRKKAVPISQFIASEIADNNSIEHKELDGVMIKPRRHVKNGAVNIWVSKMPAGLTVSINNENVGRKIQTWSPNTEVLISGENGSIRLRMKNETNPLTAPPSSLGRFSGNTSGAGGFSNMDTSFGSSAVSVSSNAFGKNNGGLGGFGQPFSGGFSNGFGQPSSNGFSGGFKDSTGNSNGGF